MPMCHAHSSYLTHTLELNIGCPLLSVIVHIMSNYSITRTVFLILKCIERQSKQGCMEKNVLKQMFSAVTRQHRQWFNLTDQKPVWICTRERFKRFISSMHYLKWQGESNKKKPVNCCSLLRNRKAKFN